MKPIASKHRSCATQATQYHRGPRRLFNCLLAATSVGYIPMGIAVEEAAPQVALLEEIVITARRREEQLQDVPIAVTALDSDYLRSQNINQFEDLSYHVPSFRVMTSNGSTNLPNISLRGQRPSEMQMATDPAVPMYFADVVITPAYGANLSMYDLANVQVLKGPQGTLFGRASTGGAVLFSPRRPGDEFAGHVEVKVGNYNLRSIDSAIDVPLSDDLKMRIAVHSVDRDGYQSNVADNALRGDDKFWDEDSNSARLTIDWNLTESLLNQTTLSYDENEMLARMPVPRVFNPDARLGGLYDRIHNGALGIGGAEIDAAIERARHFDNNEIETDIRATEIVRNTFFANTTELQLKPDLTVKNIIGYRKVDVESSSNSDGMAVPLNGSITSTTDWVTYRTRQSIQEAEQYSDELQLLGSSMDNRLEWIVGAYWYLMKGLQQTPIQIAGANPDWPAGAPPIPQLAPIWGAAQNGYLQSSPTGDVENESLALFGEFSYAINDQWAASFGLRQTWDDRAVTVRNLAANSTTWKLECGVFDVDNNRLSDGHCARTESEDFSNLTWRTVVEFTPQEDLLVYGSVSTGHRSGGFNMRGKDNFTLRPFDEEKVITYEIGQKADWNLGKQAKLRANIAIYYQDYKDIQKAQGQLVDGVFGSTIINAAEAHIQGVEADLSFAPNANLLLTLAWSYVDTGYDDWDVEEQVRDPVSNNLVVVVRDNSDAVFNWLPEQTLSGSAVYSLPVDPSIGDVSLTASVYWQDDMKTNAEYKRWSEFGWTRIDEINGTATEDAYTVWNFRVDWNSVYGSQFDIAAFVNNATDEDIIVGGFNNVDTLGLASTTLGPPRTYGASIRWKF